MAEALAPQEGSTHETSVAVAFLRATGRNSSKILPLITLDKPRIVIGRARECCICIAEAYLSRYHAVFCFINNMWHLESLGSNGVLVNFKEVPKQTVVSLADKDNVEFGCGSGMKYLFRLTHSNLPHCGPSAAKRLKTTHGTAEPVLNNIPAEGSFFATNESQREIEQLRRMLQDCEGEKQQLRAEIERIRHEKEELVCSSHRYLEDYIRSQEEVLRIRERLRYLEGLNPVDIKRQIESVMDTELTCCICCEIIISAVTLHCQHTFCESCIEQWRFINPSCPICRSFLLRHVRTPMIDSVISRIVVILDPEIQDQRRSLIAQRDAARQLQESNPGPSRMNANTPAAFVPAQQPIHRVANVSPRQAAPRRLRAAAPTGRTARNAQQISAASTAVVQRVRRPTIQAARRAPQAAATAIDPTPTATVSRTTAATQRRLALPPVMILGNPSQNSPMISPQMARPSILASPRLNQFNLLINSVFSFYVLAAFSVLFQLSVFRAWFS